MDSVKRVVALLAMLASASAAPATAQGAPAAPEGSPAQQAAAAPGGAAVAKAEGREGGAVEPGAADRTLGAHVFTPASLVRSPFTVTSFQADLWYGSGTAKGPYYDSGGLLSGEATYTFAAMGQTFAYEKKLAEGLSGAVGAVTQLYSGIDGPSAIVVGVEVGFGAFGRLTAARRLGPVQAALTFDASYAPKMGILVYDAIKRAIDTGGLDDSSAFSQQNAWTLKPGLSAAWSPHPVLGLTASLDYQWVAVDLVGGGSDHAYGLDTALAADLDLDRWIKAPVALVGAFHLTAPLGSSGISRVTAWSGGIFYSGRPALVLGLEIGHQSFALRETLDSNLDLAQIRVQYLW
jgi:hypothetical protein